MSNDEWVGSLYRDTTRVINETVRNSQQLRDFGEAMYALYDDYRTRLGLDHEQALGALSAIFTSGIRELVRMEDAE